MGLLAFILANKEKVNFIKFVTYFKDNVPGATIIVTMGIIGLSFVATAMNSLASTAFTREGAHLDIIHYLPMSYKDQIFAKSMVSFIGTYPLIALTILIWCIYTSCNPLFIPLFLALSFACFYITCLLGLYMDSLHPYTEWDDEYSALRGNLNNFFNMAIVMVISVIICGIPFLLYNFAGLSLLAFMIIVALSLGILTFICHTFIAKAIIRNIQALR
jgi:ABC-2 type transport system permease protein